MVYCNGCKYQGHWKKAIGCIYCRNHKYIGFKQKKKKPTEAVP